MKIAIIGRTKNLYKAAEMLYENGHDIKIIITDKEAPEYTKTADDFEKLAKKIGASYLCTSKINDTNVVNKLKAINLDIGISMNYTNVISKEVIDTFIYGVLNAHGGDLPRYRGNACQAWAIINGEEKIGLCIHKMIGGELDSGDIIIKDYFDIDINTKISHVYNWMDQNIPLLFSKAIELLEKNNHYVLEKQSKNLEKALRCYPRIPEDGRINWNKSNIDILRLINASSEPYTGAFCYYNNEKLIIWDADIFNDNENYCAIPGQISCIDKKDGAVNVITGKGKIRLKEIELHNKRYKPSEIIKSIRVRLN